ncbi:hypothetical protein [Ornithobacterium rhinotracheale]
MKEIFENWLINIEDKSQQTAYNYKNAITKINKHFFENENKRVDLYEINNPEELQAYVSLYESNGKYSEFGNLGNGTIRAAIKSLHRFLLDPEYLVQNITNSNVEDNELFLLNQNFSYEKDLKSSVIYQIKELFPGYEIFGNYNEGVEYSIEGKRIDILLESLDKSNLLAIELKSGLADYKVFGQISMYLGLLTERFPNKKIKGCVIAGEIDKTLKMAVITNPDISLKSYSMKISLNDE